MIQTSYLTPPMAPAIFYLRGISPPEIRLIDMYKGVLPFIAVEIVALLMVMACLSWKRLEHSPWRVAFERGLGPITLGILFAVGLKILRTADTNWAGVVVSILVCVLMLRTRISPLWFMAVAGVLGGLGVINR